MGYRSDVAAVFYPNTSLTAAEGAEAYSLFKTLMNTTYKDVFDYWKEYFEWVDDRHVLQFRCDDVKWYPSYPDVQLFTRFFEDVCDGEVPNMECEFIRIGEDSDDVERTSSEHSDYKLSVSRSINIDL